MRFSAAAVFALVSAVLAQNPTTDFDPITVPAVGATVVAGSTVDITWDYLPKYAGTVTIVLIGGPDVPHQNPVATLASKIDNSLGKFSWSVDKSLGALAVYGIQINFDSDPTIFQWGNHFPITGGATASSSGSSSIVALTSTSSTASVSTSPSASYSAVSSPSSSSSASGPATITTTTASVAAPSTTTLVTTVTAPGGGGVVSTTASSSGNLSTTATGSKTASTSGPSTVPNAAAPLAVGSFALVGCFAAALLAL